MIDTLRFEFSGVVPAQGRRGCKLSERTSSQWNKDDTEHPVVNSPNFTLTDETTGARFLGWVNPDSEEERYLVRTVELSVPRLIYGHNFREIPRADFGKALERTMRYCHEVAPPEAFIQELCPMGSGSWDLKRVDLVKQFRASSSDLIAAHRASRHPAMRSGGCEWFGESIAWKGKERMLRMYDKLQEAGKLREPSNVTRLELETKGRAMERDLGPRVNRLPVLTFDACYSAYRAQVMRLQPTSLPAAEGWIEFLAMLQRYGVTVQGVPVFEVWMRGKGKSTIRRVRAQIAAVRPSYWSWNWAEVLPEDPAAVVIVEPTAEEIERYSAASAA